MELPPFTLLSLAKDIESNSPVAGAGKRESFARGSPASKGPIALPKVINLNITDHCSYAVKVIDGVFPVQHVCGRNFMKQKKF